MYDDLFNVWISVLLLKYYKILISIKFSEEKKYKALVAQYLKIADNSNNERGECYLIFKTTLIIIII